MHKGLWITAFAAALAGCSSDTGSCQSSSAGTNFCTEYTDGNVTADSVRSGCAAAMGTYSASACASTNRVGRCTYRASGLGAVSSFYAPTTAATGRQVCALLSGAWADN